MASIAQTEALARATKDVVDQIQANTKAPSQLDSESRSSLLDAIYPRILNNGIRYRTDKRANTDYTAFEEGDFINHVDDVNKVHYSGVVLSVPLTLPLDFNNPLKFDRYNASEPAL